MVYSEQLFIISILMS